ncbi:MAG: urease accessory protein UreD [Verrucomicrobiota bacterium]
MEVTTVFGESTAVSSFASSPMKLLTPVARGKSVWAYTSSFGGGLVAGDKTQLSVKINSDVRCFLGTQSSTKVYRNPAACPASTRLTPPWVKMRYSSSPPSRCKPSLTRTTRNVGISPRIQRWTCVAGLVQCRPHRTGRTLGVQTT